MQKNMLNEKMGILEICICLILPVLLIFVDYGVGRVFNFSPLRILVIFSTLVLLLKYIRGKIKFIPTILFVPFLILLISISLSIMNAQSRFSVARGVLIQTGLILIFYLVVHAIRSGFLLRKTLRFLIITTLFACSFAYLQKMWDSRYFYPFAKYFNVYSVRVTHTLYVPGFPFYRPSSFFIDVNTFALFLVTFLPLFFCLFLYFVTSRSRSNMEYIYAVVLAVEMPVMLMTLSRNNWIGGFLGILSVVILEGKEILRNSRIRRWVLVFILIGTLPFFSRNVSNAVYLRLTEIPRALTIERGYSDNARLIAMKAGLRAFKQHPIFGIGAGSINFTEFYRKHYDLSIKEWDPHCWPIRVAAETGIIGIFANFLFMFFLIREICRARKRAVTSSNGKGDYWRFFFSGGIGGLVVLLVTSVFGQSFTAEFVYFFIGLMIASSRIAEKNESFDNNSKS